MTMNRAFSDLTIRSVDEEKRTLAGWATTPSLDRVSDSIAPLGCEFRNPAILLLQHKHDHPVGTVVFGRPTREGVPFTAHIPRIKEPGVLQDRTDEAWQSVRAKILRHVSIGFRPLDPPTPNASGGLDYPRIEILELSLVSVAAQPDAEILEVRANRGAAKRGRSAVVRLSGKAGGPVPGGECYVDGRPQIINGIPVDKQGNPLRQRAGGISLEAHAEFIRELYADQWRGLVPPTPLRSPPGHISAKEHERFRLRLNTELVRCGLAPRRGVIVKVGKPHRVVRLGPPRSRR